MKHISRKIGEQIEKALFEGDKVVIVYGPRQVGKTTLIKAILDKAKVHSIQLNAEEQLIEKAFSANSYQSMMEAIGNHNVVFIDEAQAINNLGKNIKILHDTNKEIKIILTGSSSFDLANQVQEPLTGRKTTFQLFPIGIQELLNDGRTPLQIRENLDQYLRYGLYPDVVNQSSNTEKEEVLRELTSAYLYKDLLQYAEIKHSNKLFDLLKLIALQIGSTVSVHKLANALNISNHTVDHYINLLEQSFVLFRLKGFSKNLSKEISKMDKLYFYDTGVRNAILNNFSQLEFRTDKGAIWENFIIAERIKRNEYERYRTNSYFWRTYTGAEIDYIEEKDGMLNAFEIKAGSKTAKAPNTWTSTYKNATFSTVNADNFFQFIV